MGAGAIVAIVIAVFVVFLAIRTVRIIPQAKAGVIERLGRYNRTLDAGLTIVVPFIDRLRPLIDLREQVVTFPPQPVITEDNLVVQIDTVIYFTVTDAKSVTYEVANPLQAIEQITVTTLRNVIGGMSLEAALTSRDHINGQLRVVLDEATGRWGIRVNRVELKSIDPPGSIQEAMEKQMRAERDRRAAILNAEGVKQSQILTAQGEKQAAVLTAEGAKQAAILRAEGESKAIATVFNAIHQGQPDEALLSYQYLQMLPQLAQGQANKVFVIPSEFSKGFGKLGDAFAGIGSSPNGGRPAPPPPAGPVADDDASAEAVAAAEKAAEDAAKIAEEASRPGGRPGLDLGGLPTGGFEGPAGGAVAPATESPAGPGSPPAPGDPPDAA